ncbi:hypothetical protein NO932_16520 [Pelagibacterium sp. 26DY04]|uniref:hypothetical protein n=1 Tax=Pelagibacterium sp. 26DY04 TaxID=2967130 RepID=UPI002816872E|nr:hypothetical protein [Pelagibacterium sp. 26DY04]WMT88958.1 hypothetical protein NO932_16520 [Pelagibacterium sp. 26DY04]
MVVRPVRGERVQFTDNGIIVTVVFGGWHDPHRAVASAEDNDRHHQGKGEVKGHCVGI